MYLGISNYHEVVILQISRP